MFFAKAYTKALQTYKKRVPSKHYCIDSSYVKNKYGQKCVGKNHTDRGRKALKLSLITDQNGIAFSVTTDPGNRPDVTLLSSSLEGMLLNLESLPFFADRGYDSRKNRRICTSYGLQDRIFRRKTKTVRRDLFMGNELTSTRCQPAGPPGRCGEKVLHAC